VVGEDTTIYARRNTVLDLLAEGDRTPISGDEFTARDFQRATTEAVVLANQRTVRWKAPHFVWAVRDELAEKLCGPDTPTCPELEQGGFRVTTTVDLELQAIAEKWVKLAARVPHRGDPEAVAKALGFDDYPDWVRNLENKDVRNGALVALDYQTGEIVAYVGSADYYSSADRAEFQRQ
jgi:membrane peptidoglycan carboxypeptidase